MKIQKSDVLKKKLVEKLKRLKKKLELKSRPKAVHIITVAKVGSSNFLHSMKNNKRYVIQHNHSLLNLKKTIDACTNTLIIVGIRNPIDRNLSYFFQTYSDDFYNTVKTKKNNYKGEYCYVCSNEELKKMDNNDLIKKYFDMKYHNTFNDWFSEFFEITGINKHSFDKEKGLQYYNLQSNNVIMFYTLEKLNKNENEICKFLKIKELLHSNDSNEKHYKHKYQEIKKQIKYSKPYLDSLLKTDIMSFFYTQEDIESFYKKYKISE